jgi:hypothetical protein
MQAPVGSRVDETGEYQSYYETEIPEFENCSDGSEQMMM